MALVRKILEATIPSGASSATFTDSDIPNSLIRVYSTNSNIYPQNISLSGTTLTVTYEAVTSALGVAVELVKQGLEIDDSLTSDNTDHALSAKQGKVLKGLIDAIPAGITELSDLDDVDITDLEDGQVLAWSDSDQKFVNVDPSGSDEGDIYSTSEIIVGKWIDDSNVYRKVVDMGSSVTIPYSSWLQTGISIEGITTVLRCFVPAYGSIMCGIYNTDMLNIQTPRNGDSVFAQYLIIDYLK